MRCDYCYNKDIVFAKDGKYSYNDILEFLKTRVNLLEAVVLSGGEATSHDLVPFCKEIKKLGFKIKLDTNGTNYELIKELLDLELLDFIALDYKAPKSKYKAITHSAKFDDFSKVFDLLIAKNFDFEARTTLHTDLLNENDINEIIEDLKNRGYTKTYYIQKFRDTDTNIGNLKEPTSKFDTSLLLNNIKIEYR